VKRAALVVVALAACRDGTPIASDDFAVDVRAGANAVDFGSAFPLEVVRSWRNDLTPEPWDAKALAPLVVRPEGVSRREDAVHVQETLRFAAYAFAAGDVVVDVPSFVAATRDGRAAASSEPQRLTLQVRHAVDSAAPGPIELPGEPVPERKPWIAWAFGASLLAGIGAFVVARRRRRAASNVPEHAPPPVVDPAVRARESLAALRGRPVATTDEDVAFHDDVARVLRTFVAERWGVRTAERTSEELAAAVDGASRPALVSSLGACDLVKFARHASCAAERERVLGRAVEFVSGARP
jgi:hypothetical protein